MSSLHLTLLASFLQIGAIIVGVLAYRTQQVEAGSDQERVAAGQKESHDLIQTRTDAIDARFSKVENQLHSLRKSLERSWDSPSNKVTERFDGFSVLASLSIHEQNVDRRRFLFDLYSDSSSESASSYISRDEVLIFRLMDAVGETSTVRVPLDGLDYRDLSLWAFEYGIDDSRSFIRITLNGDILVYQDFSSTFFSSPFPFEKYTIGANRNGKENLAMDLAKALVLPGTLDSELQSRFLDDLFKQEPKHSCTIAEQVGDGDA